MPSSRLADAHLTAQERLRALVTRGVMLRWRGLPGYDEDDVDPFVSAVVPLVLAAQRQSVTLTDAYLARALGRAPLGIDAPRVIGALRGDTTPGQTYRRPFVNVWTALSKGVPFEQAVAAGLARATATAAMDVQLAHRGALQAVQESDPRIRGYRRVADGGACELCASLDGAILASANDMAVHNACGCGCEPIEDDVVPSPQPTDITEFYQHGELGAMLGTAGHDHTIL